MVADIQKQTVAVLNSIADSFQEEVNNFLQGWKYAMITLELNDTNRKC